MRAVLAVVVAAVLASGAAMPHAHAASYGSHSCQACVAGSGEEAACATPDVAPARVEATDAPVPTGLAPIIGAPLGAVPGQSPPLA